MVAPLSSALIRARYRQDAQNSLTAKREHVLLAELPKHSASGRILADDVPQNRSERLVLCIVANRLDDHCKDYTGVIQVRSMRMILDIRKYAGGKMEHR